MASTTLTAAEATEPQSPHLPLPRFERTDFKDRGYYLVCEFQDEKRRRDRAAAVKCARRHPSYVCLMTSDNRLLHRNVYRLEDVPLFLELYALISTWATPRFYVMGYPISATDLMRGLECFQKMGETCNPFSERDGHSAYFGCPRASISLKYMHPKAWYSVLYAPDPAAPKKRWLRLDKLEGIDPLAHDADLDAALAAGDDAEDAARRSDVLEMRKISRRYCGCPLIQLRRAQAIYDGLPEVLELGDVWQVKPDLMGQPSLQPRSKEIYQHLLDELRLSTLPCSDRPQSAPETGTPDVDELEDDEKVDPAEERRRQLQRFSWLEDD